MTAFSSQHYNLLRDALGLGLYGSKPARNQLSLYLQEKFPDEVARLLARGLLEQFGSGELIFYKATEDGERVALANPSPRS